jgi:hypothetical protein
MSEPGPLLDRAAIQEGFRRLGDRFVRRGPLRHRRRRRTYGIGLRPLPTEPGR